MATNFPTSLDTLTNPTATDTLDSPPHDTQHADANDAIEALEAKVGIDSSAVTTSLDYRVGQLEGGATADAVKSYADSSARTTAVPSPAEGDLSYLQDTDSVEVYDGSAWAAVGGAGGGKILQVVSATYSVSTTNSTTTYADTGLSVSITPSSTSSKVLVIVDQAGCLKHSGNGGNCINLKLFRDSTELIRFLFIGAHNGISEVHNIGNVGTNYLDSPATTSAVTYKTQFANNTNAYGAQVQNNSSTSTIVAMEVSA